MSHSIRRYNNTRYIDIICTMYFYCIKRSKNTWAKYTTSSFPLNVSWQMRIAVIWSKITAKYRTGVANWGKYKHTWNSSCLRRTFQKLFDYFIIYSNSEVEFNELNTRQGFVQEQFPYCPRTDSFYFAEIESCKLRITSLWNTQPAQNLTSEFLAFPEHSEFFFLQFEQIEIAQNLSIVLFSLFTRRLRGCYSSF